jgi:hypothetical protein
LAGLVDLSTQVRFALRNIHAGQVLASRLPYSEHVMCAHKFCILNICGFYRCFYGVVVVTVVVVLISLLLLIVANQGRAFGLYRGREHGHCEPLVQHRRRRDCMWGYFLVAGWQRERESYSRIDGIGGSNVARVRSDFAEGIA